ncbi:hypothetical protein [Lacticaseibacillus saniviri]
MWMVNGKAKDPTNPSQTNPSWSLVATLGQFTNLSTGIPAATPFKLDFGRAEPFTENGTEIYGETYLNAQGLINAGITSDQKNVVPSTTRYTGLQHVAGQLIADGSTSSTLYHADSYYETRYSATPFVLKYPLKSANDDPALNLSDSILMTVPKASLASIEPGQYEARVSYTLNNALQ